MKRSRYSYENDTVVNFPYFTRNDVIDYDTLCVWRLKHMYNQQQFNTLTLFEKDNIQIMIDEYKNEYEDVFIRLNLKCYF